MGFSNYVTAFKVTMQSYYIAKQKTKAMIHIVPLRDFVTKIEIIIKC